MTSRTISMRAAGTLSAAALLSAAVGCSPDSLVKADPPSNIVMPAAVTSATSAIALYNGSAMVFNVAFGGGGSSRGNDNYVQNSGYMTDELVTGVGSNASDLRNNALVFEGGTESSQSNLYSRLQVARTAAFQARQGLQKYGPAGSNPLIGRMYALEAYTIVFLAEYFCNGVPLTMTPLEGAAVNTPGLPTAELYTRALALFDTALTLTGDSSRFANLAKVGRGRVLLDQGEFAAAAAAVADVPLTFVYNTEYKSGLSFLVGGNGYNDENWLQFPYTGGSTVVATQDHEGVNGQVWTTDPRTTVSVSNTSTGLIAPNKYPTGSSPIRLADGVEAQLIRAEAALNTSPASGEWLTILNNLRATCTTASGCTNAAGITGGTTQLPPLADSITPLKRLQQVMSERAHWLFLTGHREGDLRRMLRAPYDVAPYNLNASLVYPNGTYANVSYTGVVTAYGPDVVAIPARAEQLYNPLYQGCFDLNP